MKLLVLSLLFFIARADVLMLDLNNATGEDRSCVDADPGHVFVVNKQTMGKARITDPEKKSQCIRDYYKFERSL